MSYIDTFDHEFIGYFGGLPIYHPLVVQQGVPDDPADFGCTPEHLVIGGGGGENPAIVVIDAACAVAVFLSQWTIWCGDHDQKFYSAHKQLFDRWDAVLLNLVKPWHEVFNFAGWTVKDYANFSQICSSSAFWNPFSPERERSSFIEQWLAASIGEFVFFSMPELGNRTISLLDGPRDYVKRSIYRNVVLPPPGYPDYYGRKSANDAVTWGNLGWKITRRMPS